ncbi:hypothetical protein [Chitinibacter sp. GC72]|uniref:hypothetical protein n=1 Tax=Chitinibacter sp. GC72 TaxID=1526917 RepID=UPI0012F86FBC|nr:hypothetical protein [Chitinibacter sp. GC72]
MAENPINTPEDQYATFTKDDLKRLFDAYTPADVDNKTKQVLVGGQSLVIWMFYYGIDGSASKNPYLLTHDVDFLSNLEDARALTRRLNVTLTEAGLSNPDPCCATSVFDSVNGGKLRLDFLKTVCGLDIKKLRARSIPCDFPELGTIWIMHPLDCLTSRIANLAQIPSKRDSNGVEQARMALEVAKKYFTQRLAMSPSDAHHDAHYLRDLANSKYGLYCFQQYRIDVLEAVTQHEKISPQFAEIEWPKVKLRIQLRRESQMKLQAEMAYAKHQREQKKKTG